MSTMRAGSSGTAAWLAAAAACLPMAAIAAFWAFMWLVGSNGYFDGRGETLLFGNAALALACLAAGVVSSARLARRFHRRGRTLAFAVLAGVCLGICAATVVLVVAGLSFSIVMS